MPKEEPKPTKPLVTNIYVAMTAIMRDIVAIAKAQKNTAQGFNFRGIDDFYNGLHDIFAAHGVVTMPQVLEMEFKDHGKNAKGNTIYGARVKVKYLFIATDGTKEEAVGAGEAYDFGDKALSKAISIAHKYVLAQTFQIPTLYPDPDSQTYEASVNPTGDPYAGKTLKQLEALRDEQIKAGAKATEIQPLLGRISELRVEEQDAAQALGGQPAPTTAAAATKAPDKAPDKAAAPAAGAKAADKPAATPKPEKPKAEKPVAPPKPPVEDTPPGAAADENDFGGADTTPDPAPPVDSEAAKVNAACEFVINPEILKHADYAGRKLGSLSRKEVNILVEKWYGKFKADIDSSPLKATMRDALFIVKAQWDKSPEAP